jgi:hypothetical protein
VGALTITSPASGQRGVLGLPFEERGMALIPRKYIGNSMNFKGTVPVFFQALNEQ